MSSRFDDYLANRGITHQTTVPYNLSHQNGVSERAIRTLTEKARVMMFDANTPLSLWAEAINCATFIVNRLPSTAVKNEYPYKHWYKKFPVLDGLCPFGCLAYAYIPESVRSSKLSPRSIRGVMVGYAPTEHAYRVVDLDSGTVVVSNNVKFDEYFVSLPVYEQCSTFCDCVEAVFFTCVCVFLFLSLSAWGSGLHMSCLILQWLLIRLSWIL